MLYIQTHCHSLHSESWNVRFLSVKALKSDRTVPRDACLGLGTIFKPYGELDRFCPDVFVRPPQCKIARAHSRSRELKDSATLLYSGVTRGASSSVQVVRQLPEGKRYSKGAHDEVDELTPRVRSEALYLRRPHSVSSQKNCGHRTPSASSLIAEYGDARSS